MSKIKSESIQFIKIVAQGLEEFNENAVFVGGATVPFYLESEMVSAARSTEDIDVVIEVISAGNREKFEDSLRKKGFKNDVSENAPICRWKFKGLTVDIMSPAEKVMGFTNRWYSMGAKNSKIVSADGVEVRILTLPYFLATKLEAFKSRGKNDFMGSSDLEDIVTIFEGAPVDLLLEGLENLNEEVAKYLIHEFTNLYENSHFKNALPGIVFDRVNAKKTIETVLARINFFLNLLKTKQ